MTNTSVSLSVLGSSVFVVSAVTYVPASNIGGWGGDNSNAPNATNPWFKRGGQANNAANAGVFAFNRNTGAGNANIGWRAVLAGV